jgi:ankyrin repeat protein
VPAGVRSRIASEELRPHVDAFVLAATSGRRERAEATLAAHPGVADDPWAQLVLGRGWDGDPSAPGGPRGWAPLLYAAHSVFAPRGLLRELLVRGADPSATFVNEHGRMSALYGAAGVVHDPEMTRLLLEAGADPDDNESLYHATEAASSECLRLLLEHGAATADTNALAHALDHDRVEHVRLLLEAGADPNESASLAHAVRRGRGPEFIRLLARHGADLDRPGGETWRGNVPLRTPYQHAILRNRMDVAETLAELGAATDVAPQDLAVAARGRGEERELPAELDVDAQEVLILAVLGGRRDAAPPSFRGVVGGSPEGSLLQHAAWVGDPELVGYLLDAGADAEGAVAWAVHGSQYHRLPGRDYVAVVERLLAAGAELEPQFADEADGPLRDRLAAQR